MKKVMATGVFDILHLGHIHFLAESKKLGDELVVVVARDSTAQRSGKSSIFDEESRLKLVKQLRIVDEAFLGHEGDIYQTVADIKPDIITLGYDQHFDVDEVRNKCRAIGLNTEVVRIGKFSDSKYKSSSQVREKLLQIIEDRI